MKTLTRFLCIMIVFSLPLFAEAQDIDSVYSDAPLTDNWAHRIRPMSVTFKADVDIAGDPLLFTVERAVHQLIMDDDDYELIITELINSDGIYEWDIPFPTEDLWDVRARFDGPGFSKMIQLETIDPRLHPSPQISYMEINGNYLTIVGEAIRYNSGDSHFPADMVLTVNNTTLGIIAYGPDAHPISSVGAWDQVTHTWDIFLPLLWNGGDLCALLEIYISHDWAGIQDFTDEFVAATSGTNCQYWPGLSTGITIWNVLATLPQERFEFRVCDVNGRVVMNGANAQAFNPESLPNGIYFMTAIDTNPVTKTRLQYTSKIPVFR
jgi:hypothetical protein